MTLFDHGLLPQQAENQESDADPETKRWDWVRRWMAECEHHEICSKAVRDRASTSWFPTRLLDVRTGLVENGCKRYLLIETAKETLNDHRYATLSHIWGSDQEPAYRTVKHNYQARTTDGIPRDELPPCFQDAIDVAEKLNIPYIWIDSLCIIQDDEVDRPKEAGSMDRVYNNSFLNLSATASTSSKDRLPSVAKKDHLQEPRFVGTAWTGLFAGVYQIYDPHFWTDRVTSTRLASRGWIFQERALAPRVLHFGFDQVLWECAESERAEEFPIKVPQIFNHTRHRDFKWSLNNDRSQDVGDPEQARARHHVLDQQWTVAIDNYTRCELTRPADKLTAISGVARMLSSRFQDEYIAGLWQSNIIGGLCWRVSNMRRTTQNLIPSGLYAR